MEGISVKSLYLDLGMSIVIGLYLVDNDTSLLISLPHFLGIFLTVWKLAQASRLEKKDSFPYFTLTDKQSYADTPTKQFDSEAMHYMSYALYPGMLCYTVYSYLYNQHKTPYSFILNTLVGGIYMFGFI